MHTGDRARFIEQQHIQNPRLAVYFKRGSKADIKIVQDGNDYPIIGLDNEAFSTMNVKEVEVSLSGKMIKTIKLKDNSFWEKVRRTFL